MRELQIPPRCEGCPRLRGHIEHFDSHAEELDTVSALSPETIETGRGSIIDVLSYLGLRTHRLMIVSLRLMIQELAFWSKRSMRRTVWRKYSRASRSILMVALANSLCVRLAAMA